MRGQGLDAQAALLAPKTAAGAPAAASAGGWSDPYGPTLDGRIRHARTAARLEEIRAAVQANMHGDHEPLAAMLGGHTPRFAPGDLARLIRHIDRRGAELAREAASTSVTAGPSAAAAAERAAGEARPTVTRRPGRVPPPDKARPGDVEGVMKLYDYEAGLVVRGFRHVGASGAAAVLRDAVASAAQRIAAPAGRADVAVGATSGGRVDVMRPGARITTAAGETAAIGMVELRVDADGFVTLRARSTPIGENQSATVLGGFAIQAERSNVVRAGGRPLGEASASEPPMSVPAPR
ncbi:MAG: hypothetical protein IT385_10765 [Deltaproteobacteria bacterium]|nr:hypothetical protein [Deltaproteobacteria bacterium]